MDSTATPLTNRIGFHYYPDTLHFRQSDLQNWLPQLKAMGARWLILTAPLDRAIPEPFLKGLIQAGIEPVLHFQPSLVEPPAATEETSTLLNSYAKWGVRYVLFFDRPNLRSAWTSAAWAQEDLVERFLDRFVPLAEAALDAGLKPVFPPLQPGGDYWDTAFLRSALLSIQRRKLTELLEKMILSAYAWTHNRPLSWGAGGPERWPGARPYLTPAGEEDQLGFCIYDWYLAIARAVLGRSLPILLLGLSGSHAPQTGLAAVPDPDFVLTLAQLLNRSEHLEQVAPARETAGEAPLQPAAQPQPAADPVPLPEEVLCGSFWLLAAEEGSPLAAQAWFQPGGEAQPAVEALRAHESRRQEAAGAVRDGSADWAEDVRHYLLLPVYEWGVSDWHLDIIRPFVKKHQPTLGFSLREAAGAQRVTVVGGEEFFSEDDLNRLRALGCWVERISGDGTTIATTLAER